MLNIDLTKTRKKYLLTLLVLNICIMLSACGGSKKYVLTTGFQENELFRIDDNSCYSYEALVYLVNMKNSYNSIYGSEYFSVSVGGVDPINNMNDSVLAKLTKVKVLNEMAEDYRITLDDSELNIINSLASDYYQGLSISDKSLMGLDSLDKVKELYSEYRIAEKVYEYIVKDVNPEISDDEARTMLVKEIFLTTKSKVNGENLILEEKAAVKNKAEEAVEKLSDGMDFDSVAADYSDLDQIQFAYTKMSIDPQIKEAAFELSKDELSDILEGSDGYYILYCDEPFDRNETDTTKLQIINERKTLAFENAYNKYAEGRKCYFNGEIWNVVKAELDKNSDSSNFFKLYENYFGQ